MDNITGDKGLYNKFVSLDGDWTKNKVHSYVLIVLISYFATKILYSTAYKVYSYESLENEVLSFALLMILTGIIFLTSRIGDRAVLGGKSGANCLFFFGMMLGINLPMVYRETMFKETSGDKDTHYLLYTLVIIIVLLSIGLTLVSTEKKTQYALYSFVLLVISITTIMARINKIPNDEGFTVDIYTTGDSDDKKLKEEITQNENELNVLRNQLSNMQKTHSNTNKRLGDLQHDHNKLLGSHSALLGSTSRTALDSCPQSKKRSGDIANYYMAAGAFAISLLLTSDSKDKTVNAFISILQGVLLGGVVSGLAVGVLKKSNVCGGSDRGPSSGGPSSPRTSTGCKPYIYELNDTASSILYVTAGVLIIGCFAAAFYLGNGKGLIWSLGLFFITLPVIALVLYVMVLGARKKVKNPHCTPGHSPTPAGHSHHMHLPGNIPWELGLPIPGSGPTPGKCGNDTSISSFLNSVSFTSSGGAAGAYSAAGAVGSGTPSNSSDCSCDNLDKCQEKKSTIKNEKYNPVYLILLITLSIISIGGGIHEVMKGNIMTMIIFLVVVPVILSIIFLPLFFKDINKKIIFHYNLKKTYTKCCKSGVTATKCFPHMTISNTKTYALFIGAAVLSLLIGASGYNIMENSLLLIGTIALAAMCIVTLVILKTVMKMNNFHFGLDAYIGLTDLIFAKKESDLNSSDVSMFAGMNNSEKVITGDDFSINKKYKSDLQSAVDSGDHHSLGANLNRGGVMIMPKNVCKLLYYKSKRAEPIVVNNYKHKGCSTFESCTYSGTTNKLHDLQLAEGFVAIYTCTRDSWKTGAGILTIVLALVLIMFLVSYFINKQGMRIKAT